MFYAGNDVALFDMDGSLAAYTPKLVAGLELLRAPEEPVIDENNIWEYSDLLHISNRIKLIKSQARWWYDLEAIAEGMAVVDAAKSIGFHIAILTKGPQNHPAAWGEKLQWCQTNMGYHTDVTVTIDKSRVYGKVLYGDYKTYMEAWLAVHPRGLGIMPVTPGNASFTHSRVVKYRGSVDLPLVIKALRIAKDRKPGSPLILNLES